MTRDDAITHIERLYPADSQYSDTAATGQALMKKAIEECGGWRELPEAILARYAELCIDLHMAL